MCVNTRFVPEYRSITSRVAAICGLVSTFERAGPGVDVSNATAVSEAPNTSAAHAAPSITRGSISPGQRSGSAIRRNPPSAAAPGPTQRVGSTRWVCTSITGSGSSERGVGGIQLERRDLGYVEEAAAVRLIDRPQGCRRAPSVRRVCRLRRAGSSSGVADDVSHPRERGPVGPSPGHRVVLVTRHRPEQRRHGTHERRRYVVGPNRHQAGGRPPRPGVPAPRNSPRPAPSLFRRGRFLALPSARRRAMDRRRHACRVVGDVAVVDPVGGGHGREQGRVRDAASPTTTTRRPT